jgi:hypothetical protein
LLGWWYTTVISALGKLRQKNLKLRQHGETLSQEKKGKGKKSWLLLINAKMVSPMPQISKRLWWPSSSWNEGQILPLCAQLCHTDVSLCHAVPCVQWPWCRGSCHSQLGLLESLTQSLSLSMFFFFKLPFYFGIILDLGKSCRVQSGFKIGSSSTS